MEDENAITCMTSKDAHCMWGKMQYPHYDLNSHNMRKL
jgi:hypothetical protein